MKKIRTAFVWFILAQPFLDIYWFYVPPLSDIFHFAIPTLFRIIALVSLTGFFLADNCNQKRFVKQRWLQLYLAVLLIYALCHLYHVRNFNSISPNDYGYSTISEIFYLIRLFLPLLVIYLARYLEVSQKQYEHIIQGLVGVTSGVIVFSNLFVKSLSSYNNWVKLNWIKANIFSWFTNTKYSYFFLSSKGFFFLANTTSAILLMLLPLTLWLVVRHFNWQNVTILVLQMLAMLMLGTKTATLGFGIVMIGFLIVYAIHIFILRNETFTWKALVAFLAIFLCYGVLFTVSPSNKRVAFEASIAQKETHSKGKLSEKTLDAKMTRGLARAKTKKEKRNFLRRFIGKYHNNYSINPRFILKSYPYQRDPYFWKKVMHWPAYDRMNGRRVEETMLNKVRETNNNKWDKWLGISFTRLSNIYSIERDFVSQSYSLGYIGMALFLFPYLGILLYSLFYWLRERACRDLAISSLLMTNALALAAAFYAGNFMDFLTATLILGFMSGYLLSRIHDQRQISMKSITAKSQN